MGLEAAADDVVCTVSIITSGEEDDVITSGDDEICVAVILDGDKDDDVEIEISGVLGERIVLLFDNIDGDGTLVSSLTSLF
jgi:hypothetical protein